MTPGAQDLSALTVRKPYAIRRKFAFWSSIILRLQKEC